MTGDKCVSAPLPLLGVPWVSTNHRGSISHEAVIAILNFCLLLPRSVPSYESHDTSPLQFPYHFRYCQLCISTTTYVPRRFQVSVYIDTGRAWQGNEESSA